MTKKDLIEDITLKAGRNVLRKDVAMIIDMVFGKIEKELIHKGKFTLKGFGTWKVRLRKKRKIDSPIFKGVISASKGVSFKAGKSLKFKLKKKGKSE